MVTETLSDSQSMIRLFMGYIPTRVIYVAAKLGIADHISDDGASAPDQDSAPEEPSFTQIASRYLS